MMKKQERARFVAQVLEDLFPKPEIPLAHKDPYTLLIAVLLSARCTDKMVNKITPDLFAKASTPRQMIKLSEGEIRKIIQPCGLSPAKAKAILGLSHILLEKYEGKVPCEMEALEELPGVGHKTASVVICQAFGVPAFPIDTHIHRCAERWGLSSGKNVKQTERDLKKLFPETSWIKLHLQIIHYARAYCPAVGHKIEKCPMCTLLSKNILN